MPRKVSIYEIVNASARKWFAYFLRVYTFVVGYSNYYPVRTCTARGKAVNTKKKIATSRNLGIRATYKHSKSVKIVEKLTTLCFESFGKAHEY